MDGENNGKPYFLMDDLGGKPPIFGFTSICTSATSNFGVSGLHRPQTGEVLGTQMTTTWWIFGRPCHRPMGSNRTQGNTRDFDAKKRNNRKI